MVIFSARCPRRASLDLAKEFCLVPHATLSIGDRIGPYEIVTILGYGAMGMVFRARDTRLGRDVALKVLSGQTAMDPDALARFHRESTAAAALNHPGLCTIYDVGEERGITYLAFELLDGETLRQRLSRGPLSREELLEAGIALADAIDSMHRAGIVHCDLKPENVMRTSAGAWKILDLGIARSFHSNLQAGSTAAMTETGVFVGTARYGSPEQLTGRDVDGRSDVFSLGAVLYEAATGHRAFGGDTLEAILYAIVNTPPRPLAASSNLTGRCEMALMRALEKDPSRRFATAADLRDELMACRSPR